MTRKNIVFVASLAIVCLLVFAGLFWQRFSTMNGPVVDTGGYELALMRLDSLPVPEGKFSGHKIVDMETRDWYFGCPAAEVTNSAYLLITIHDSRTTDAALLQELYFIPTEDGKPRSPDLDNNERQGWGLSYDPYTEDPADDIVGARSVGMVVRLENTESHCHCLLAGATYTIFCRTMDDDQWRANMEGHLRYKIRIPDDLRGGEAIVCTLDLAKGEVYVPDLSPK